MIDRICGLMPVTALLVCMLCGAGAVGPAGDPACEGVPDTETHDAWHKEQQANPRPEIRGWDVDVDSQAEFENEYWGRISKRLDFVKEVESQPEMAKIRKLIKQLAKRGYRVEINVVGK